MTHRKPSPALVISIAALVMATTGTAIAAVDFARNAGAVDGKSAVSAGSSLARASGNLVATARGGAERGRIPGKFLADVARAEQFGVAIDVPDNATGAPVELVSQAATDNFGRLTATCNDRSEAPGQEDPDLTVSFANTSGGTANLARRVGVNPGEFAYVANNATDQFRIGTENTFLYHLQQGGTNALMQGVMRQEGRNTGAGQCIVYGTLTFVR
jgi:hypothetical protein